MDAQPKNRPGESAHVEDADMDADLTKQQVMSAELANALTIDQLSPWSRTGLKLSWLIVVTGISTFVTFFS